MIRIHSFVPLTLALMAASQAQAQGVSLERRVLAMGTTLAMDLSGTSETQLKAASEKALSEVARIEAGISTWREDSAFSQLNRAHGAPVHLAHEWFDLLSATRLLALRTGGAFDPALGPLIEAWGLREGGGQPSKSALQKARLVSGFRLLRLDARDGVVQLLEPFAAVEEGGFGKGYALDRVAQRLQADGCASGLLDFGGQFLAFGAARMVSLADPRDRSRPRLSIRLQEASLASSGTSEKGPHILDPHRGRPCPPWGSVAVIAPSGLEADCLSTALYVMGPLNGLRWATRQRLPACFLLNNGQIRMSPAFRALAPLFPSPES